MSAFILKIIACITMFIDHIGYVIFDGTSYFNYVGRLAFPIFAFQISQGYIHTRNFKNYFVRLLVFAIISQLPFILFYNSVSSGFAVNVIFTLLFGLISIFIYDKLNKFLGIISAIILSIIAHICHFDYGAYGISIILLFYIFKDKKALLILSFMLATFIKYFCNVAFKLKNDSNTLIHLLNKNVPLFICTCLASIFICLYNGKKGHNSKYLLYLFYPLHLILIYILTLV